MANAAAGQKELAHLKDEINAILNPVRGEKYIVFHDAYQYFEASFNIPASGAIAFSDASQPGPARIATIKGRVKDEDIGCVLSEPQFNPGIIASVMADMEGDIGVLDAVGYDLNPGRDLYPELLRNLAKALAECLG
jgi:zinc transport system substrate-binding protein